MALTTLTPGTRLGPYEIVALLGVGGMGEVYRATDTHLKRQVAIKVLPASVAGDPERLARFQREAEVLATLNHPNIAAIYGFEKAAGTFALVMELVEGPTLAEIITGGGRSAVGARPDNAHRPSPIAHGLPLDEALPIAKQIAEALEAAHEHGIIHRDLKPANIKVREDGAVKVLDFGLAKAMEGAGGPGRAGSAGRDDLSQSPTITTPAMTQAGMILGTAAYMSPEQAKGRIVDKRSDLWAFGAVLYEMLTGRRAFAGDDVSDTIVAVLRDDPNWAALPVDTPATIRKLLWRCLEKDRKRRIESAADARLEIEDALAPTAPEARLTGAASAVGAANSAATPSAPRSVAPTLIASVLGTALVVGLATWALTRPGPVPAYVEQFVITTPADAFPSLTLPPSPLAISPNGRRLVYRTLRGGANNVTDAVLYLRDLAQPEPTPIPGTEGAIAPFFPQTESGSRSRMAWTTR